MGWKYTYLILENCDLDQLKQKTNDSKIIFTDMTEKFNEAINLDNKRKEIWNNLLSGNDSDKNKKIKKLLNEEINSEAEKLLHSEGYYLLIFRRFNEHLLLSYTRAISDPIDQYFAIALFKLQTFGYRGKVVRVHANSIADGVDIERILIANDYIASLSNESNPDEVYYLDFLDRQELGLNLKEYHDYILREDAVDHEKAEMVLEIQLQSKK